jgi:hypothetical protein
MKRRLKPPVPTKNLAPGADAILQVKFWLTGIGPMVWWRVLVSATFTLRELHGVIQVAIGWKGIHLYDFHLRAARYGSFEVGASQNLPGGWRTVVPPIAHRCAAAVTAPGHAGSALPGAFPLFLADGDHAFDEADILDTKPHQLGSPGAGLQQCLRHQSGAAIPGVSLVKEARLFLDRQPIDIAPMFRGRPKAGALPGGFEDGLALCVVHTLAHKDGGRDGGGAFDGAHDPVCFRTPGVQAVGLQRLTWATVAGGQRAGTAFSFPLHLLWKAHLPAIGSGGSSCA